MTQKEQIIISILERILGKPKRNYKDIVQYEFNCPSEVCKHDVDKFNWNFHAQDNIFRCWKCNYKGIVHKFVTDYGTKEDYKNVNEVLPLKDQKKYIEELNKKKKESINDYVTCELPDGYRPLTQKYDSKYYRDAIAYLQQRRIGEEIIKKYNIGYTESGPRKFRIIIPSYNIDGKTNYYQARAYLSWMELKYYNPDEPGKSEIIFNASNINFDLPVFLTEGAFDMLPLYNCIPLLGKDIPDILMAKLLEHKTKVILCLDEDALKDSIKIYHKLTELGLDVYFVEVKDDIAKHFEKYGKEGIVKLLQGYKKLTLEYIMSLSMKDKKNNVNKLNEKMLNKEWLELQKAFKEQSQ